MILVACTEADGGPEPQPIEPAFVGVYLIDWHFTPGDGCFKPAPFSGVTTATIRDHGEVRWGSRHGEVVHQGWMIDGELVVPPGEDGGVERLEYSIRRSPVSADVLVTDLSWDFGENTSWCTPTLTRVGQEN